MNRVFQPPFCWKIVKTDYRPDIRYLNRSLADANSGCQLDSDLRGASFGMPAYCPPPTVSAPGLNAFAASKAFTATQLLSMHRTVMLQRNRLQWSLIPPVAAIGSLILFAVS